MGTYDELGTSEQGLQSFFAELKSRLDALERRQTIRSYTTAARPGASTVTGAVIFNLTTSKHQGSNGTTWSDLY